MDGREVDIREKCAVIGTLIGEVTWYSPNSECDQFTHPERWSVCVRELADMGTYVALVLWRIHE